MTEKELRRISESMSANRNKIYPQNRKKYDIEALDTYNVIRAEMGNPEVVEDLLARWESRVWWLSHIPNAHIAPPSLIRLKNETREEHLERCHIAGGCLDAS